MYAKLHDELFPGPQSAQAANDAGLVSAVLLVAESLDQSPPTTKEAVRDKLAGILGDAYAGRAVANALRLTGERRARDLWLASVVSGTLTGTPIAPS